MSLSAEVNFFVMNEKRRSGVRFQIRTLLNRDRAAFLRLGELNKMPKAFLALAAGASVLGGSGGMLRRKIFPINASRIAKNTSRYSRHGEFFYQPNKHQI